MLIESVCFARPFAAGAHHNLPPKPEVYVIWNSDPDEFPSDPLADLAEAARWYDKYRMFRSGQQSNFGGYHESGFWYDRSTCRLRYTELNWNENGNEHVQQLWSGVTLDRLNRLAKQPHGDYEGVLKSLGCKELGYWYHQDPVKPN